MKHLKMYKNFGPIQEKLGISDEVAITARKVLTAFEENKPSNLKRKKFKDGSYGYVPNKWKFLKSESFKFDLDKEHFDNFMMDNIMSLTIDFNPKYAKKFNAQMSLNVINPPHKTKKNMVMAKLNLARYPTFALIVHEIQHMYEYVRRIEDNKFRSSKKRGWYYDFDTSKIINDKNIKAFSNAVYYAQPDEINSRVQEFYHREKHNITNKKEFINVVKNSYEYKKAIDLQTVFKNAGDDYLYDLINKLNYIYKRKYLFDEELKQGGVLYPIEIAFELYVKNVGHHFTKEMSEEQIKGFLNYWDKYFKKMGKRFERRLWKLYDLMDLKDK